MTLLKAVLRGEPTFQTKTGKREVFPNLRFTRYYGAHPGTSDKPLQAVIARLEAAGVLGRNAKGFLCHTRYLQGASIPEVDA